MGFPNIWNLIPRLNLTHLVTYICVYMCVCLWVWVCVYTHMCVGVYIYTHTHTYMGAHTHTHTHVCIHVCHTNICLFFWGLFVWLGVFCLFFGVLCFILSYLMNLSSHAFLLISSEVTGSSRTALHWEFSHRHFFLWGGNYCVRGAADRGVESLRFQVGIVRR